MPSCMKCREGRGTKVGADGKFYCGTCILKLDARARAKADAAAIYKAEYAAALKEIREEARLAATREAAATKK